jgi:glycerol-3-phosphate O-acyltransferase/dihydroxyacetone phosphate acyltransferase
MLQRLVIWLVRIVTSTFFRRIEVVGIENVPESGPVIFAGNHPNALMDGWLLTAKCGRWPLHFLANAKLWNYRVLVPILNATGAVPVYRREEHAGDVDNSKAFDRIFEVIEAGHCVGIFPEGISHVESQLITLKTGTARIALTVADRGKVVADIVPCGLNYIHRHRFRSQVLIEFGAPIRIDRQWLEAYREDGQATVVRLTAHIANALKAVTLNAPDWKTMRFIQTARRLYKPSTKELTPSQYVELNRRFVDAYLTDRHDPDVQALQNDVEDYQSRLDMLGLRDHQLRNPITFGYALRKVALRCLTMLALLPLAIPGALLHLPVGWAAATIGERFSYEMDDIATLKVFATILLLPVMYTAIAIFVGMTFGTWWAIATIIGLTFSFFASVRLVEAEAGLLLSVIAVFRLARLGGEVEEIRITRAELVRRIRDRVEQRIDPAMQRIFTPGDFRKSRDDDQID